MNIRKLLLVLCLMLFLPAARAELVVIANADSGIKEMTRDELINIYLGRFRRLPSGLVAEPIDGPAESTLRAHFYHLLVNKNLSEINAYWARLVFSGRTRPPQASLNAEDAIRLVMQKPTALTYIPRELADGRVRIVYSFAP